MKDATPTTAQARQDRRTPYATEGLAMPGWWLHQWLDTTTRIARVQLAWLDVMAELTRHEADFLKVAARNGERLSRCAWDEATRTDPTILTQCYHKAATEMADAALIKLTKVSELSHDFREQIWDEI